MVKTQRLQALLELIACIAIFVAFGMALPSDEQDLPFLGVQGIPSLTGIAFWLGVRLRPTTQDRSRWVVTIERTFIGTGLVLLFNGVMAYALLWLPPPVGQVVLGGVTTGCVLGLMSILFEPPPESVLLVGTQLAEPIAATLGKHLAGVVAPEGDPPVPALAGISPVYSLNQLERILEERRPARVMLAPMHDALRDEPALRQYALTGAPVESTAAAYERLYLRVSSKGLKPTDVLSASPLAASPAMMSLQAAYSNVIGLTFLIVLSPLLAILAIASRIAAGPGTVLDRVECAGFEGIPFYRLRYRLMSARTGRMTWVGRVIVALRLTGLPQLINLVRGEMAMFGPSPARLEFAKRMQLLVPFYAHRHTMRPGLLGWAQTHLMLERTVREEVLQLEYDLYYVKHCTPSLDLEIFLRMLLHIPHNPAGKNTPLTTTPLTRSTMP